jgi:spore germination cell wall hydrolase CwlJ-like protein
MLGAFLALLLAIAPSTASTHCITSTVYGEARGESEIGQALVAQTILNRVADPRYPSTACAVVAQPKQFAGYQAAFPKTAAQRDAWELAKQITDAVQAGNFRVGSCGRATHFHEASVTPAWAPRLRRLCRVDNHIFYQELPR